MLDVKLVYFLRSRRFSMKIFELNPLTKTSRINYGYILAWVRANTLVQMIYLKQRVKTKHFFIMRSLGPGLVISVHTHWLLVSLLQCQATKSLFKWELLSCLKVKNIRSSNEVLSENIFWPAKKFIVLKLFSNFDPKFIFEFNPQT